MTLAVALLALACDKGDSAGTTKKDSGRVAAVEAAEDTKDPAEVAKEYCDVVRGADDAPAFSYPALADGASGQAGKARWINVWATWCKPCVEELPRIQSFKDKLAKDGVPTQVELIASDEPAALTEFAAAHPEAKATLRMADATPETLTAWLTSLQIESAALPVHLFVDAENRLRCARLGGVGPDDYPSVRAVMKSF